MDDKSIISLFSCRDERAIAESESKYGRYCHRVAMNILRDEGTAEESVNDTWLAAWNKIPPAVPVCLRAFFGKITRNVALSKYRNSRAGKRGGGETDLILDELADLVPSDYSLENDYISAQIVKEIDRFLRMLPETERCVFVGRYYYAYSVKELASAHGKSESHIRTLLSRTRKQIRKYLEEGSWIG